MVARYNVQALRQVFGSFHLDVANTVPAVTVTYIHES